MKFKHRLNVVPGAALLGLLLGCNAEFPLADVSGVVTLNGEPLSNAMVFFQPRPKGNNLMVGPPSFGVTDEEGNYQVSTHKLGPGAVIGTHVVSISTFESRMKDPKNSDATEVVSRERVPKRYRSPSELRFDVTSGGTNDANFDLTAK